MSLALAVHAYKNLMDTTPLEFVTRLHNQDRPAMPSTNYKIKIKTPAGTMTEEDYKWLMKYHNRSDQAKHSINRITFLNAVLNDTLLSK